MGVFIWHDWAHFVAVTACIYTVWSGFWGLIYRKFFWDFVNGTLRFPGGLQPANQDKIFVNIIVKAPIVQIISIIMAVFLLAIEMGMPPLKNTALSRSWVPRIVMFMILAFFTILFYQGTNAALYSTIAAAGYTMAQARGETPKNKNRDEGKA